MRHEDVYWVKPKTTKVEVVAASMDLNIDGLRAKTSQPCVYNVTS